MTRIAIPAIAWLLLTAALAAAEPVSNPEYATWMDFEPGATSVLRMTGAYTGQPARQATIVSKLLKVEADAVTVERTVAIGEGDEQQVVSQEAEVVPATIDDSELDPVFANIGKRAAQVGERVIKTAGRSLPSIGYRVSGSEEATHVDGEVWACPKVPGAVVQFTGKYRDADGEGTLTLELIAFEPAD